MGRVSNSPRTIAHGFAVRQLILSPACQFRHAITIQQFSLPPRQICAYLPAIDQEVPDDQQLNLKGALILADPSLRDSNFSRSVILLTDHSNESGAHGYILNRPLGKTVGEVLPSDDFPGIASVPIFFGGPVDHEQLNFASLEWDSEVSEIAIRTHLSTAIAGEQVARGAVVRAYVGYSGWASGQLEAELQQRAWITGKASEIVMRREMIDKLWADILRTMGPYYTLLAETPNDPSLN